MCTELTASSPMHLTEAQMLERSRYFGPNLLTFLATSEETKGAFSLIKFKLRKGYEPPLHIHTREEESIIILDGEILYQIGDQRFHAKAGDYIHLPRLIPHTFKLGSDTATLLLTITPGGLERMFIECSRPAESMELPLTPVVAPEKGFIEKIKRISTELGVQFLP